MRTTSCVVTALLALLPAAIAAQNDWRVNGQDGAATRYSSLTQITTSNVATLKRAWTYDTGEPANAFQTTPLVVDGIMYLRYARTTNRRARTRRPGRRSGSTTRRTSGPARIAVCRTGPGRRHESADLLAPATAGCWRSTRRAGSRSRRSGRTGRSTCASASPTSFRTRCSTSRRRRRVYKNLIILGPRDGGECAERQGARGRHPRVQRDHRHARLELPHAAAPGRARLRDMGTERVAGRRGSERVGRHHGRRTTVAWSSCRPVSVTAAAPPENRAGINSVRELRARARRSTRQAEVVLPDRASRSMGLRRAGPAGADRRQAERPHAFPPSRRSPSRACCSSSTA